MRVKQPCLYGYVKRKKKANKMARMRFVSVKILDMIICMNIVYLLRKQDVTGHFNKEKHQQYKWRSKNMEKQFVITTVEADRHVIEISEYVETRRKEQIQIKSKYELLQSYNCRTFGYRNAKFILTY